ncbi:MAG TPA: glycosyltransferase family 2 protein [Gemmataceae bacterium]|nr:glycosyltransferase family 2 protein [Gemmataceae bacterium]
MPNPIAAVVPPSSGMANDAKEGEESIRGTQPLRSGWNGAERESARIDVSVCIANWNCRDLLQACLQSLLDQPQGVRVETIVADNASTDGAPEMVAREFPEVILHRNSTNVGFARANNQAAQHARGRYLFFLNNDTVVPPGALGRLVHYAEAHPEVGMIGPRLRDGQGQPQVSYRQRPTAGTLLHRTSLLRWTGLLRRAYRRYRRQDFDPETTRPVEVLMGAAMLLPRDVFFSCGGWDEGFCFGGEDLDLSTRVGQRHPIVYHPGVEITHFGRVSTRQHIGYASSNMAIGFLRYLRKCGYAWPVLTLYKLVVTLDAPLQVAGKGLQYLWRRLRGQHAKAEKSRLAMQGQAYFLVRGLPAFWRT